MKANPLVLRNIVDLNLHPYTSGPMDIEISLRLLHALAKDTNNPLAEFHHQINEKIHALYKLFLLKQEVRDEK
jgi:hypothetical protein